MFQYQLLMVVDSAKPYSRLRIKPDLVLVRKSPKINFERFLDSVQPGKVIVDGSNYPYLVEKWKKTSDQKNIPFHYTREKGYYAINKRD